MKRLYAFAVLVLAANLLLGCGGSRHDEGTGSADSGSRGEDLYTSSVLTTDHEGALAAGSQLALGSLKLADTDLAISAEQASGLLPLWRALQGGVTAATEVRAVLKQIETRLTREQLLAIADMRLGEDDLRGWLEEHPGTFGQPGGALPRDGDAGPGRFGEMSDQEREALRATAETGGGLSGGQGALGGRGVGDGAEIPPEMATHRAAFASMSDEQREELRATMQAGRDAFAGRSSPGAQPGGSGRAFVMLVGPLVAMLEQVSGAGASQ